MNIYDRQLAISGGTLHHIGLLLERDERAARADARPTVVCAWCDSEAGVAHKPRDPLVSHGICARHHAEQMAEAARMHLERRAA